MTFSKAVRSALGSYATFSGRARRSEYWWFYLFTVLVNIASSGIDAAINASVNNEIGVVGLVTSLALLLPSIAVTARRLHDTGRTGWWMLFPVVPFVGIVILGIAAAVATAFGPAADGVPTAGWIIALVVCGLLTLAAMITVLVFLCLDSERGPNRYGNPPKQPPMAPSWPGSYYPPAGYGAVPPAWGYGPSYGHPQSPPAPPVPDARPPQS